MVTASVNPNPYPNPKTAFFKKKIDPDPDPALYWHPPTTANSLSLPQPQRIFHTTFTARLYYHLAAWNKLTYINGMIAAYHLLLLLSLICSTKAVYEIENWYMHAQSLA